MAMAMVFQVPELAHQHDVGVLAERGAQGRLERPGVRPHLALVHQAALVVVHELDWILDGDDVVVPVAVHVVEQGGERGRLARAGGAGDEHEPLREEAQVEDRLREAHVLRRADLGGMRRIAEPMPRRSEKTLTRKRAPSVAWTKSVSELSSNSVRLLAGAMAQSMSASRPSSRGPNSCSGATSPSTRRAGACPDARWRSEAPRATISASSRCTASPGSTGSGTVVAGCSTAAGGALAAGAGAGEREPRPRPGRWPRRGPGASRRGRRRPTPRTRPPRNRPGTGREEGPALAREAGLHLGRDNLHEGADDLRGGERLADQDPQLAVHREDRALGGLEAELPRWLAARRSMNASRRAIPFTSGGERPGPRGPGRRARPGRAPGAGRTARPGSGSPPAARATRGRRRRPGRRGARRPRG